MPASHGSVPHGRPSASILTVVILTFNESRHIERCIRSAQRVADDILVVDALSTDDTVALARRLGARVMQNSWRNHSTQMNWALANGGIRSDWVMRLDADEYLDEQLVSNVKPAIANAGGDIGAFELNRRIRFLGHPIRHGGMAPLWVTRLWRKGRAHCESRWMDEHMVLSNGKISRVPGLIIDDNLNSLAWWTAKHNDYSSREAIDVLDQRHGLGMAADVGPALNRQARTKRWLKTRVYARLPLGLRPWLYFFYRAVLRCGFCDGARGMVFHTLQGLWYRLLVDAKVLEVEAAMNREGWDVRMAVSRVLGIDIGLPNAAPPEHEPG